MDDQTAARHAEAAETLQRILDEHGDDYGAWERQVLERAIAWFRANAHRGGPDARSDDA